MVNRVLNIFNKIEQKYSVFLFGPRGVGKSRLIEQYIQDLKERGLSYLFIELLKSEFLRRYLLEPEQIRKDIENKILEIEDKRLTVVIDEIQKVPALLNEVHYLIEKYPDKINFLLTGSSARKLKRNGVNLLGGRAWNLKLHTISDLEIQINLESALQFGLLPAVYFKKVEPKRFLTSYIETYLKEEIKEEGIVRKFESFLRFLDLTGSLHGKLINFSKTAKLVGVSTNTLQEYFSILEDTLIARRIDPWSYSIKQQLSKAPRYYIFDCGVVNALNGDLGSELKKSTSRYGNLFETFIVNELLNQNDYLEKEFKFYHWHTYQDAEIDLILSKGPSKLPIAVEIKSSIKPDITELSALKAFKEEYPDAKAYVLCNTELPYRIFDESVRVMPWREGIREIMES